VSEPARMLMSYLCSPAAIFLPLVGSRGTCSFLAGCWRSGSWDGFVAYPKIFPVRCDKNEQPI